MVTLHPDSPLMEQIMKQPPTLAQQLAGPSAREELDRMGISKKVRLEIPLAQQHDLRRVADLLHGLATRMEVAARRTDIPERIALMEIFYDVKATNKKIAANLKRRKTQNLVSP